MKILFWNTYKNASINPLIYDIAKSYSIDLIILAEYCDDISALSESLGMVHYQSSGCNKLEILGKIENVEQAAQNNRYSVHLINNKYIMCAVHLPDNLHPDSHRRREITIRLLLKDLNDLENKLGTKMSFIVGDFNEDPYDDGCLSATSFHSLPCFSDAQKIRRTIEGVQFETFYNPMWNLFGDFTSPPGTYYYNGSNVKCSFWHIYDQVIIRPVLKEIFFESSLEIITQAGSNSLLDDSGRPNKKYSDHLPLVFEIRG